MPTRLPSAPPSPERTTAVRRCATQVVLVSAFLFCNVPSGAAESTGPIVQDTCDTPRPTNFNILAGHAAPVLWFSPDEPLLGPNRLRATAIPNQLPPPWVDEAPPSQVSIVYYRISRLHARPGTAVSEIEPGPRLAFRNVPFEKLSRIDILYLLYYPEDIGFNGHIHDLEAVEVQLMVDDVQRDDRVCHTTRVSKVLGAAHGSDWYTNILEIDESEVSDLVLPVHILVEEGKHASAPDRNADGWFTPGYDATVRSNDAWGVRGTLRNRRLSGRMYDAKNAKDRCRRSVIKTSSYHPLTKQTYRSLRQRRALSDCYTENEVSAQAYHLLEAGGVGGDEYCEDGQVVPLEDEQEFLGQLLSQWNFCAPAAVQDLKPENSLANLFVGPEGPGRNTARDRFTWAYAWHAGNGHNLKTGITMGLGGGFPLEGIGGWLVPRLSLYGFVKVSSLFGTEPVPGEVVKGASGRGWGIDVLYTPSGSRPLDWYMAMGRSDYGNGQGAEAVQEMGLKIRFPALGLKRFNSLAGIRIGYRGALLRRVAEGRFVIEAALGGW